MAYTTRNGQQGQGTQARQGARTGADPNDIWGERTPYSDPILVVSRKVPDLRYLGRAYNRDFHLVFEHLARATMSENTQLYRNLCLRILPGWEVWREGMRFAQGNFLKETMTLAGARSFLSALADCPLTPEARERVEEVSAAFVDSTPEGTLFIIPEGSPYDPNERHIPSLPLRAICRDRLMYPLLVHDTERWLPLAYLCRWYRLPYGGIRHFMAQGASRRYDTREWIVPGVNRVPQFYVPEEAAPDFLLELAGYWRSMNARCWQRTVYLGNALANGAHVDGSAVWTSAPNRNQAQNQGQKQTGSLPLRPDGQARARQDAGFAQGNAGYRQAGVQNRGQWQGAQRAQGQTRGQAGAYAGGQAGGQAGRYARQTGAYNAGHAGYTARGPQGTVQRAAQGPAQRPAQDVSNEPGLLQRQLESLVASMKYLEKSVQEITARLSRIEGEKKPLAVEASTRPGRALPALEPGTTPIPLN